MSERKMIAQRWWYRLGAMSCAAYFSGLLFFFLFSILTNFYQSTPLLDMNSFDSFGFARFFVWCANIFGWPFVWFAERWMPNNRFRYLVWGLVGACLSGALIGFLIWTQQNYHDTFHYYLDSKSAVKVTLLIMALCVSSGLFIGTIFSIFLEMPYQLTKLKKLG